jgi:hypothetical protein
VTSKPLSAPTLSEIERALDETLSALVEYRMRPPKAFGRAPRSKQSAGPPELIDARDLLSTGRTVIAARSLVRAPVEIAMKRSLKELGKLAHALVGDDGMHDIAHRVCALEPDNWGRRMSPLDSAWSGIGSWVS